MSELDVLKVLSAIEQMVCVYDIENTSLADFVRDVKQCHALYWFLHDNYLSQPLVKYLCV